MPGQCRTAFSNTILFLGYPLGAFAGGVDFVLFDVLNEGPLKRPISFKKALLLEMHHF